MWALPAWSPWSSGFPGARAGNGPGVVPGSAAHIPPSPDADPLRAPGRAPLVHGPSVADLASVVARLAAAISCIEPSGLSGGGTPDGCSRYPRPRGAAAVRQRAPPGRTGWTDQLLPSWGAGAPSEALSLGGALLARECGIDARRGQHAGPGPGGTFGLPLLLSLVLSCTGTRPGRIPTSPEWPKSGRVPDRLRPVPVVFRYAVRPERKRLERFPFCSCSLFSRGEVCGGEWPAGPTGACGWGAVEARAQKAHPQPTNPSHLLTATAAANSPPKTTRAHPHPVPGGMRSAGRRPPFNHRVDHDAIHRPGAGGSRRASLLPGRRPPGSRG